MLKYSIVQMFIKRINMLTDTVNSPCSEWYNSSNPRSCRNNWTIARIITIRYNSITRLSDCYV